MELQQSIFPTTGDELNKSLFSGILGVALLLLYPQKVMGVGVVGTEKTELESGIELKFSPVPV